MFDHVDGTWKVPNTQAGPRKAHWLDSRNALLCGKPTGPVMWLPESQAGNGAGQPWGRCVECLARLGVA